MLKQKKIYFPIILFFLVVITIILLSEIVIRVDLTLGKKKRKIWIPDPYIGFVHAPNNDFVWENKGDQVFSIRHQTNSFGFLGKEISKEKGENVIRIMMMGDSFTEALQIERGKSFVDLIRQLLEKEEQFKGKEIEVINAGVSGYCPIIQYLLYKKVLHEFSPDLVVLQVWTNDVFEDNKIGAMSVLDDQGYPIKINRFFAKPYVEKDALFIKKRLKQIARWKKVHDFIINQSRFYEYMYTILVKLNKNSQLNKQMRERPEFNDRFQFFITQSEHSLYNDEVFHKRTLSQSRHYIKGLKNIVENSGARFFLFYIPFEQQLKLEEYGIYSKQYRQGPVNNNINHFLKEVCIDNKMNCLDLLDDFEANKNEGLYINWDGHLNERGHALVGEKVVDYILEKELLK